MNIMYIEVIGMMKWFKTLFLRRPPIFREPNDPLIDMRCKMWYNSPWRGLDGKWIR